MTVMYMQIPGIDGNVTSQGYDKWIEVHGLQFHTKRQINQVTGNAVDREASRPMVSEMTINKKLDQASPKLLIEALTGTAQDTVKLHCLTTSSSPKPYMTYELSNVILSGYHTNSSSETSPNSSAPTAGGQKTAGVSTYPDETVTLSFTKLETSFTPFDEKHQAQAAITSGYDLQQGVKI